MKISKPILKSKTMQNLVAATVSVALTGMVFFGVHAVSEKANETYSSINQIFSIEKYIGADSSYRADNPRRLQHNGDEPIYIDIADDYEQGLKTDIEEAIEYVFGLVNEINDNYKYEIVEDVKSDEYKGKSYISFQVEDLSDTIAGNALYDTVFSSIFTTKGRIVNNSTINIDSDLVKNNKSHVKSIAIHELLHCFGIDDVYMKNDNGYHGNTFINTSYTYLKFHKITPNDYKLLASFYAPEFKTQEEFDNYVALINERVDEYSREFYSEYNESVTQSKIEDLLGLGFSEERTEEIIKTNNINNNIDVTFDKVMNAKGVESIRVKVKGDKYVLATFDKDSNMIDVCEGKAFNVDGKVYLQNVHLNSFWVNSSESFMDMCVSQNAKTKEYSLEDLNTLEYSKSGIDFSMENGFDLVQ